MRAFLGLMMVMGCGGSSDGPKVDASTGGDLDSRVRACAIIGACVGYTANQCIALLDTAASAAQIECVNAATAADCTAVRACIGLQLTADPACVPGCADADTVVRCSGGQRLETDCATTLEDVGPACITNGRSDCGGAACTVDGEYTCSGAVSSLCDSGITEVVDCSKLGLECVTASPRCAGVASGTCTAGTAASCDGDTLVTCDAGTLRRQDCSLFGGRTCIAGKCALGSECDPATPDTCTGTTLDACFAGVHRTIDCTTIGATSCVSGRCR